MRAIRKSVLLSFMAGMLAACLPAQPTPSADEIRAQIATAVAMTIAVQNAQTEQALPTATETATLTPTALPTLTPVLPTATPFIIAPPPSSSGSGGGSYRADYSCDFTQRPFDNSVFLPGDPFNIKWVITNTGTKTWPAGQDFKYFSGPLMTGVTLIELPEMKPGATFSVKLDADAPSELGFHVMTWVVEGGLCYPYVAIQVVRSRK